MKDKPARFGLKEFTLADSTNGCVLDIIVYTGKENAVDSKSLAERVVLRLLEPYYGLGHNIFMDNHCTSVGLFEKLYNNGVQACGTCRGDRIGLPRDVTKANSDKVKKLKRGEAKRDCNMCYIERQEASNSYNNTASISRHSFC